MSKFAQRDTHTVYSRIKIQTKNSQNCKQCFGIHPVQYNDGLSFPLINLKSNCSFLEVETELWDCPSLNIHRQVCVFEYYVLKACSYLQTKDQELIYSSRIDFFPLFMCPIVLSAPVGTFFEFSGALLFKLLELTSFMTCQRQEK